MRPKEKRLEALVQLALGTDRDGEARNAALQALRLASKEGLTIAFGSKERKHGLMSEEEESFFRALPLPVLGWFAGMLSEPYRSLFIDAAILRNQQYQDWLRKTGKPPNWRPPGW